MTDDKDKSQRTMDRRSWIVLGLVLAIVLSIRWELTAHLPSQWMPDWSKDFVFVSQASHIQDGRWLGDYDFRQLRQPPGFSLTLAALDQGGIPLRIFNFLLLAIGGFLILIALIRLGIPPPLAAIAFIGVVFCPAFYGQLATRLAIPNLFSLQGLLAIGLCLMIVGVKETKWFSVHAALLTLILAWASITSAHWLRLVPYLGLGFFLRWHIRRHLSADRKKLIVEGLLVTFLAVLGVQGAQGWVKAKNESHYGVSLITEMDEPHFQAALGAIQRVARVEKHEMGALSANQRKSLYQVSQKFAELEAVLESPLYSGPESEDDKIGRPAALLAKAIREAAAQAGKHKDPKTAIAFYSDLAREINQACDEKRIKSLDTTLINDSPRWNMSGIGKALHGLWYKTHELWRFDYEDVEPAQALAQVAANPSEVAIYKSILLEDPFHMAVHPYQDADRRNRIRSWYQVVVPALFFAALIAFITQMAWRRERGFDSLFLVESFFFICALLGALTISLEEVFWLPNRGRDLLLAYPLLVVWSTISLHAYVRFQGGKKRLIERQVPALLLFVAASTIVLWIFVTTLAKSCATPLLESAPQTFDPYYVFQHGSEMSIVDGKIAMELVDKDSQATFRFRKILTTPPRDLIIRGFITKEDMDSSFEVSWSGTRTDELGGQKRRLFPKRIGSNEWVIPLSRGRLEAVSFWSETKPGLKLSLERLGLRPATQEFATGSFPVPTVRAHMRADGKLAVNLIGGERESRYEFYLSGALDAQARKFPERTGSMWLNDEAGLKNADGEDCTFFLVTDKSGSGMATYQFNEQQKMPSELFIQGVGTKHFTPAIQVSKDP